jgi:hypothetical protein
VSRPRWRRRTPTETTKARRGIGACACVARAGARNPASVSVLGLTREVTASARAGGPDRRARRSAPARGASAAGSPTADRAMFAPSTRRAENRTGLLVRLLGPGLCQARTVPDRRELVPDVRRRRARPPRSAASPARSRARRRARRTPGGATPCGRAPPSTRLVRAFTTLKWRCRRHAHPQHLRLHRVRARIERAPGEHPTPNGGFGPRRVPHAPARVRTAGRTSSVPQIAPNGRAVRAPVGASHADRRRPSCRGCARRARRQHRGRRARP